MQAVRGSFGGPTKIARSGARILFGGTLLLTGCLGTIAEPLAHDRTTEDAASATTPDTRHGPDATTDGSTTELGGSGGKDGPSKPTGPIPGGGPAVPDACGTPGPRLIRRLSAAQYRNTLVDLFDGDESVPSADVLADPVDFGFHVDADSAVIRDLGAQQLLTFTEKVAAWAVANELQRIAPCQTKDSACGERFITTFGARALREPLSPEMTARYQALFDAEDSFEAGVESVLSAMLMSPYLLFRRELGEEQADGSYELTDYEIATELSYLITDSAPDAALRDAASQGVLRTREELDRQAERLLATPRGRQTLARFVDGWVDIERLKTVVKDESTTKLPATLRGKLLAEAEQLFVDAFDSGLDLSDLLTARHTFMDRELSDFYGANASSSDVLERVELADSSRRLPGLLGTGAFLASHALADATSPVKRGYFVRTRMLCQTLPDPPSNVDTNLKPPPPGTTNRERYLAHSQNPACASCHQLMDPVGFSFEHFDTFGRYQERDHGLAIDDSGTLKGTPKGDLPLRGAAPLLDYLARDEEVEACLVRFWSYYAYARATWTDQSCTRGTIFEEARAEGGTLKSVFMALLHAPHFSRRVQD